MHCSRGFYLEGLPRNRSHSFRKTNYSLVGNKVDADGVCALADALRGNNTLTTLE